MIKLGADFLDEYMQSDIVLERLQSAANAEEESLTCNQWLMQTPAKRAIFYHFYPFCFAQSKRLKILDIGGGVTSFTSQMAAEHDYILCDLMAHDSVERAKQVLGLDSFSFLQKCDWADLPDDEYDLIIANDFLPNVDQRLELFIEKFLPMTKELVLSLTAYDEARSYLTRRVEADEFLTFLAWNSEMISRVLEKYKGRIVNADFSVFEKKEKSQYSNGRQVYLIRLNGDL